MLGSEPQFNKDSKANERRFLGFFFFYSQVLEGFWGTPEKPHREIKAGRRQRVSCRTWVTCLYEGLQWSAFGVVPGLGPDWSIQSKQCWVC